MSPTTTPIRSNPKTCSMPPSSPGTGAPGQMAALAACGADPVLGYALLDGFLAVAAHRPTMPALPGSTRIPGVLAVVPAERGGQAPGDQSGPIDGYCLPIAG